MKAARKDFKVFKAYFRTYQLRFGLIGYKVYFKHEPLDGCFANISVDQSDMVATVRLNSNLPDNSEQHKDAKQSALHEVLHLLIMRLEQMAKCRHVQAEEIYEASEELVHKLEELIGCSSQ